MTLITHLKRLAAGAVAVFVPLALLFAAIYLPGQIWPRYPAVIAFLFIATMFLGLCYMVGELLVDGVYGSRTRRR